MNTRNIALVTPPMSDSRSDQRSLVGSSRSGRDSVGSRRSITAPSLTMPEPAPLSVQAGLVGLIAATGRAERDLEGLARRSMDENDTLKEVVDALRHFSHSVRQLRAALSRLEAGTLARPERAKLVNLDLLIATLTASILTVSALGERIDEMMRASRIANLATADVQCLRTLHPQLAIDANRISMVDYIVTNILCILQINNESQVEECRKQALGSITDMLKSDILLAVRIADLEDPYDAKSLVMQERLEEIARRPPPSYSEPKTDAQPPTYTETSSHADGSITIPHECWSCFSGLTLADVNATPLLPLPVVHTELKHGHVYAPGFADASQRASEEYHRRVSDSSNSLRELLGGRVAGHGELLGGLARRIFSRTPPSPQ